MTRTISTALQASLEKDVTSLSYLWKITRTDAVVYNFTDSDVNIVYGGSTYKSMNSGTLSALSQKSGGSVDNIDFQVVLDDSDIPRNDVIAGLFDHADVKVYLIDRTDTTAGAVSLIRGKMGQSEVLDDHNARIELRSLGQLLKQPTGRVYTHECDVEYGSTRCGVDVTSTAYTSTGTITGVTDNQNFADGNRVEASDYYNYGNLTFTSGNNNGLVIEVKDFSSGTGEFILREPAPFSVSTADTYSVHKGCAKTLTACKESSNIINFRGFSDIPGYDQISKIPDLNPDSGLHD